MHGDGADEMVARRVDVTALVPTEAQRRVVCRDEQLDGRVNAQLHRKIRGRLQMKGAIHNALCQTDDLITTRNRYDLYEERLHCKSVEPGGMHQCPGCTCDLSGNHTMLCPCPLRCSQSQRHKPERKKSTPQPRG